MAWHAEAVATLRIINITRTLCLDHISIVGMTIARVVAIFIIVVVAIIISITVTTVTIAIVANNNIPITPSSVTNRIAITYIIATSPSSPNNTHSDDNQ